MNTSLYLIEDSLQQLADLREQAESEGDSEALKVIDDQLAAYLTREAGKVDSYVGLIRRKMDDAAACEFEADRLNQRAKALLADVDRLKANVLAVMQQFDVKAISSPTNTIRRQKNGGLQPLQLSEDENIIPCEYRKVVMRVPVQLVQTIMDAIRGPVGSLADQVEVVLKPQIIDTEAIRKALAMEVPCIECKGTGEMDRVNACPRCRGRGIIPATVPGARLRERGEHVRLA